MNADEFLARASMIEAGLEQTLEIPLTRCGVPKAIHNPACHACADQSASDPHWTSEPARSAPRASLEARFSDLSEFVRCIAEGEPFFSAETGVGGQRAIELAAWELYRKLQESHDL
jgi:hypothetical protein